MKYKIMALGFLLWFTGIATAQTSDPGMNSKVSKDSCSVILPSAFTPNNDGLNDQLKILCRCELSKTRLEIYNRWGDLVFHSEDRFQGWDGTAHGQAQPAGTYVWVVMYQRRENQQSVEGSVQGTLALLR